MIRSSVQSVVTLLLAVSVMTLLMAALEMTN